MREETQKIHSASMQRSSMRTKDSSDAEVRIAVRVPVTLHHQIRRRAREQRLSVNQAIVQAIDRFSGQPSSQMREELRDLLDICKIAGASLSPQFKSVVNEHVKALYGFDLPLSFFPEDRKGEEVQEGTQ